MSGLNLMDQTQAVDKVRERMDSGDWWILVVADEDSAERLSQVESSHYDGDANADFELLMGGGGPSPLVGIALAHKRHMSAADLGKQLGLPSSQMDKDILFLSHNQEMALALATWFASTFRASGGAEAPKR